MTELPENKKSNNNIVKWLVFVSIPAQMGAVIYIFYLLGGYLDVKYGTSNAILENIFVFIGIFLSLYQVYAQLKFVNKKDSKSD